MSLLIRYMQLEDEIPLRRLVMQYLKETYASGGDFPPTLENASAFTMHAIRGAVEGDPCVVGEEDSKLVGFVVMRGLHFPGMQTRYRTVRSWGSFVIPARRGTGYAVQLFMVCKRLAAHAGYTRFLGMTHGADYESRGERVARKIGGIREVGKILMMDLTEGLPEAEVVVDASSQVELEPVAVI